MHQTLSITPSRVRVRGYDSDTLLHAQIRMNTLSAEAMREIMKVSRYSIRIMITNSEFTMTNQLTYVMKN